MRNLALAVFLLALPATAAVPDLSAPVTDLGHVLSDATVSRLNQFLIRILQQGGPQIAVLTVPDLGGDVIESFSIKVVEKAKLGSAKDDNGVLLLLALKERKVRIEVGQGLEGVLTDAQSRRIVDLAIVPLLKRGDFDAAMETGVVHILDATFPQGLNDSQAPAPKASRSSGKDSKIIFLLIVIWLIFQFLRPRRRRFFGPAWGGLGGVAVGGLGGWGGGSSGGGWSGGGGGFSGGGSSGNW